MTLEQLQKQRKELLFERVKGGKVSDLKLKAIENRIEQLQFNKWKNEAGCLGGLFYEKYKKITT